MDPTAWPPAKAETPILPPRFTGETGLLWTLREPTFVDPFFPPEAVELRDSSGEYTTTPNGPTLTVSVGSASPAILPTPPAAATAGEVAVIVPTPAVTWTPRRTIVCAGEHGDGSSRCPDVRARDPAQPHGALANFRGKLVRCLAHDAPSYSGIGDLGKPGAVHIAASILDFVTSLGIPTAVKARPRRLLCRTGLATSRPPSAPGVVVGSPAAGAICRGRVLPLRRSRSRR